MLSGIGASSASPTCSLISIPISLGQPFIGPDSAPGLLKEHGLLQILGDSGWRVEQLPDIQAAPSVNTNKDRDALVSFRDESAKNCAQVGATCFNVYEQVYATAQSDKVCIYSFSCLVYACYVRHSAAKLTSVLFDLSIAILTPVHSNFGR